MTEDSRLEQLERRVKADPTSVVFAALAEEYRRAGRFDEAIEVCRKGLTRHPAYLSARVTLGRALIEVGALEEAEVELQEVLEAAPENLAAIRGLAELHTRSGEKADPVPPAQSAADELAVRAEPARHETVNVDVVPTVERTEPPLPDAPSPEVPPGVSASASGDDDPALAALQEFLDAIRAARAARVPARP